MGASGEDGFDIVVSGVGFGESAEEDDSGSELGEGGGLVGVVWIFKEGACGFANGAVERVESVEGVVGVGRWRPFFEENGFKVFVYVEPSRDGEFALF